MSGSGLTYDQWVKRSSTEAVPPNSDGLLHVGERAALIEQLSYLKKRNAQLMKQQRAVLLAACEAQAAHAQCADFAGELMRAQMLADDAAAADDAASVASATSGTSRASAKKRARRLFGLGFPKRSGRSKSAEPEGGGGGGGAARSGDGDDADDPQSAASLAAGLQRLEHENSELLRKTSVLVDYVRATAPLPVASLPNAPPDDDDDSDDDDDDDDPEGALPPRDGQLVRAGCLPEPANFDDFAGTMGRKCKWDSFVTGVVSAFGARGAAFPDDVP